MPPRRGFTLIEMLVVMTVGSVMLGVAVSTLFMLLRAETAGRNRVRQCRVIGHLSEQFRADAAEATGPIMPEAGPPVQWRFALPDGRTAVYRALSGAIEREEFRDGKPLRRESFPLPAGASASLDLRAEAVPATASLTVGPPSAAESGGALFRIDAVLGKDHRFTKPIGGSR
jgi:prepilin-type N-terminal cleavage/methylation domain-containing protein